MDIIYEIGGHIQSQNYEYAFPLALSIATRSSVIACLHTAASGWLARNATSTRSNGFIDDMPSIQKDPFDRMLVTQAMVEGITQQTADCYVAQYPGPVRKV